MYLQIVIDNLFSSIYTFNINICELGRGQKLIELKTLDVLDTLGKLNTVKEGWGDGHIH